MNQKSPAAELLSLFIRKGFFFLIMYFLFDAVKTFAGKETKTYAEVFIGVLAGLQADKWAAYIFGLLYGGSSTLLYLKEKKLRRDTEIYYTKIIEQLKNGVRNGTAI